MNHVSDIQWINTFLNIGVIPLIYLIHKLDKSIDKLRLDMTREFVTKTDFDEYKREHRKDLHDD